MRKEDIIGSAHGEVGNNGCHQTEVSHCEKCGIELTRNDIREYGSLCWSCWRREYAHQNLKNTEAVIKKSIKIRTFVISKHHVG